MLSPVLFCVYIDDLLLLLAKAGIGCHIGAHFVSALAYADNKKRETSGEEVMKK